MDHQPILIFCQDDGKFPNNHLPAILYKDILRLPVLLMASSVTAVFARHHWNNAWDAGVFTYDHYHSITHEVLGFYRGKTTLRLGGEKGHEVQVEKGDVLVIPAGVAHKNLGAEYAVKCIGAYPDGRDYDIRRGLPGDRPGTDKSISMVPLPEMDPFYGEGKGICNLWSVEFMVGGKVFAAGTNTPFRG
jgi:uncharacterized protein YjlB